MRPHVTKLVFVLVALTAFAHAAAISDVARSHAVLNKRFVFGKGFFTRKNRDMVPFSELDHEYLAGTPQSEAYKGYPNTYFYKGKPVFRAEQGVGVSKKELERAYSLFGGVYVTDHLGKNPATIAPGLEQKPSVDENLVKFLRERDYVRQHFGEEAAKVAYGRDMKPLNLNFFSLYNPFRPHDPRIKMGAKASQIRGRLDQLRQVQIPAINGGSHLKIGVLPNGKVYIVEVLGRLRYEFQHLHVPVHLPI